MTTRRPPLRYFGAKARLAPWIVSYFPPHTCYCEPYCGAAGVFFHKTPSTIEVINDIDSQVVNFFRTLREETERFIQAIQMTPYSRDEYTQALQPSRDSFEDARRFYIRSWQGWLGNNRRDTSWRYQTNDNSGKSLAADWNATEHLWGIAWRLKQALIENDDALTVIARYDTPDTLFYLDPPYQSHTISLRWANHAYTHNVDDQHHRQLLHQLQHIQGMAIISSYPSPMYEHMLRDWQRRTTTTRTTNTANTKTEVIWISPAATRRHPQMQLPYRDKP